MVSSKLGTFPVTELTVWVVFQLTTFDGVCTIFVPSYALFFQSWICFQCVTLLVRMGNVSPMGYVIATGAGLDPRVHQV